ncbi:MAG: hypothetical protein L0I05_09410 [Lactobacillus sp.]|uniref:hypothetical protein n=1 Tax=Lactobacillus sp. TaxID=1591 RepID=UPI0026486104|nr:hypothetical protein [Lactobacillus sp.]MDN6009336.1 hypothetical protein [Lactobacillus sp.]
MSYEKQTWNKYDELKTEEENIENGAVVTDNRMNHMESGIGDNDANLASHLADKNNPHKVTAAQVGLGNVQNFGLATEDEAKQGISNAKYMTPSLTQAVLSANINSIAYANSADGTDGFTTVYPNLNLLDRTKDFSGDWINSWTWSNDGTYKGLTVKKRTAQWNGISKSFIAQEEGNYTFSAYVKSSGGNANITRFCILNTVGVDSLKKGLGNNFDWTRDSLTINLKAGDKVSVRYEISSTEADSILWTAGHKWEPGSTATPWMPSSSEVTTADWPNYVGFSNTVKTNKSASDYTWFPIKDSELTNKVDSHINNKANPHSVTASQVGAYSKDESDQKLATQKQAIDSHVNNKANPHAVTASQVGAYSKQEIDTKLSKAVMADDSGKVSIGTLDSNTLTVQGTKIYPNTKDGVWTVERLFDNEYRLTTVMSVSEAVAYAWNSLFISSPITHTAIPSGYIELSFTSSMANTSSLMWCAPDTNTSFRIVSGEKSQGASRKVIVTVYATK